jgi:hypothetical protein
MTAQKHKLIESGGFELSSTGATFVTQYVPPITLWLRPCGFGPRPELLYQGVRRSSRARLLPKVSLGGRRIFRQHRSGPDRTADEVAVAIRTDAAEGIGPAIRAERALEGKYPRLTERSGSV